MNFRAYLINQLRRLWLRSTARNECFKNSRVSRGSYRCNICQKLFKRKEVQCDHIKRIGKFKDWNSYISKLFCDESNLQILCKECHCQKTNCENSSHKTNAKTIQTINENK